MPDNLAMTTFSNAVALRKLVLKALLKPNSVKKVALAQWIRAQNTTFFIATNISHQEFAGVPGYPARPELRTHLDVQMCSPYTTEGLAALLHAATHIQFNVINLLSGTNAGELSNQRCITRQVRLVTGGR